MSNGLLLWVDDEIELLKAHIIFLEKKGYEVVTVSNGADAIDQCRQQTFDLILLDEMMPGLSGLEAVILTLGGCAGSVLFAWALWRYVSSRGAKAVVKDKSGDVLRDDLQKGGEG